MYILNKDTLRVHQSIDGKTHEACNIDQIVRSVVYDSLQELRRDHPHTHMCKRCFR